MKLELKHLAPYLPYKLQIFSKYNNSEKGITWTLEPKNIYNVLEYDSRKPILRPLFDLSNVNGFSLSDMVSHGAHNDFWLKENFEVKYLMYLDFEKLVSWHFDVFGLIDKGLAIDINTLKTII